MNVKTLIAATAIALLGSQAAFAQETTGKTREQVKAELAQARIAGIDNAGREIGLPLTPSRSHKTRAQVTQELVAARDAGELEPGVTYGFIDAPRARQAPVHAHAQ